MPIFRKIFQPNVCASCGMSSSYHIEVWVNELVERLFPVFPVPRVFEVWCAIFLEKFFLFFRCVSVQKRFRLSDIQLRTACFIEAAQKRGASFSIIRGPQGHTSHFFAHVNGKTIRFEGLPTAEFKSSRGIDLVNCKERTKKYLKEGGFPIVQGQSFWFWQKKQARAYAHTLGYPLVVKPEGGSISRHVTTDIRTDEALLRAIESSCRYSPVFLLERFVEHASLYRATVVDMTHVACVAQIPAHVRGNGRQTVRELMDEKNVLQGRGDPSQKDRTLYYLKADEAILAGQGCGFHDIPSEGSIVRLQKDPFLKLGADLSDMTGVMHSDNKKLFLDIARYFDIRLVGIDFLTSDISRSWKEQACAILELNNLPCIEMHHFPSIGNPAPVAERVVDMFWKYYV